MHCPFCGDTVKDDDREGMADHLVSQHKMKMDGAYDIINTVEFAQLEIGGEVDREEAHPRWQSRERY
jgi:hypothetical protein